MGDGSFELDPLLPAVCCDLLRDGSAAQSADRDERSFHDPQACRVAFKSWSAAHQRTWLRQLIEEHAYYSAMADAPLEDLSGPLLRDVLCDTQVELRLVTKERDQARSRLGACESVVQAAITFEAGEPDPNGGERLFYTTDAAEAVARAVRALPKEYKL